MSDPPPTSAETAPKPRRAAVVFIFVTVVLDVLALGIVIPVLPRLVESFLGGNTARAAELFGLFGTAWALMQFVFSPIAGALSDRFGRRPVILVSNFGLGLDYILMAMAPNLWWLFAGRVISGITAASFSAATAYIADVTPADKRAAAFGLMGAGFGLGFVLGPAVGGILGGIDPRLPFWVASGLSLTNGIYGLFVLPESLPPERRQVFSLRRANPVGALKLLGSHRELYGLATVGFFYQVAHNVLPAVFVLYASYRYGWNERTVGLTLGGVGVCAMIVQGGLVGPVVERIGERSALLLGLFFGAAGFTWYGLAPTGFLFCCGIPLMALWGFYQPAAQGLMTRRVGPSEQGQLQGANASLAGIAALVSPGLYTQTFARAIAPDITWQLPGAPFLLSALFLLGALALALRVTRAP